MADQRVHYYLNQFQLPPTTRRWWPTALAICAFLGGIYGASLGSAVGAVPGAADIIGIAAATLAVICGIPGTRLGSLIGIVSRVRFGRLVLGNVCRNWRGDPGRILGDHDSARLWSDSRSRGRLGVGTRTPGPATRHSSEISGWNCGCWAGDVRWSHPLGSQSQSVGSPRGRNLGFGNRGRRRPAAPFDGRWGVECGWRTRTSAVEECCRGDFPTRRSRRASCIHLCSRKRE